MTVNAVPRSGRRSQARAEPERPRRIFTLPFLGLVALAAAAGGIVSYVLWPTSRARRSTLDAPAIPVTVAGVLFDVPPARYPRGGAAASRAAGARRPRLRWPSLAPPQADEIDRSKPLDVENATAQAAAKRRQAPVRDHRGLGAVLPPLERLRTIYPRYVETQAAAGADGLAILPFRTGTPYEGEDLLYVADNPEQFLPAARVHRAPCPAPACRNAARQRRRDAAVSARLAVQNGERRRRLRSADGAITPGELERNRFPLVPAKVGNPE